MMFSKAAAVAICVVLATTTTATASGEGGEVGSGSGATEAGEASGKSKPKKFQVNDPFNKPAKPMATPSTGTETGRPTEEEVFEECMKQALTEIAKMVVGDMGEKVSAKARGRRTHTDDYDYYDNDDTYGGLEVYCPAAMGDCVGNDTVAGNEACRAFLIEKFDGDDDGDNIAEQAAEVGPEASALVQCVLGAFGSGSGSGGSGSFWGSASFSGSAEMYKYYYEKMEKMNNPGWNDDYWNDDFWGSGSSGYLSYFSSGSFDFDFVGSGGMFSGWWWENDEFGFLDGSFGNAWLGTAFGFSGYGSGSYSGSSGISENGAWDVDEWWDTQGLAMIRHDFHKGLDAEDCMMKKCPSAWKACQEQDTGACKQLSEKEEEPTVATAAAAGAEATALLGCYTDKCKEFSEDAENTEDGENTGDVENTKDGKKTSNGETFDMLEQLEKMCKEKEDYIPPAADAILKLLADVPISLTAVVPLDIDLSKITPAEMKDVKTKLIAMFAKAGGFTPAEVKEIILTQKPKLMNRQRRAVNEPITATIIFKSDSKIDLDEATGNLNQAIKAGTVTVTVTIGGVTQTAILKEMATGTSVDGLIAANPLEITLSACTTLQPIGVVAAIAIAVLGVVGV